MVLKTGGSMLLSIGAYAWLYGWKFAVGFVVLLFVHEMGHSIAAKACGLKVSAPVFIPFLGAQILLKEMPPNAWVEAIVGYGGPLLGTLGGLVAFAIGVYTGSPLFYALASSAFFLNLFNLVPIIPMDGGRIVTAISPWLWIVGILLLIPYLLFSLSGAGIYILILVATSLPRVWRQFKNRNDPESQRYYECTPSQRALVTLAYFGLVFFLAIAMSETHSILSPR
ncbi:MAG: site-2 protease family protein [Myxococcales bacterium]|nr:site-2 protease family protein [Myxococcales bacterium]